MTQTFDDAGRVQPATLIRVAPVKVTQVKTLEKDGYAAVQLGSHSLKKPGKRDAKKPYRHLREERSEGEAPPVGADLSVEVFAPGDIVTISGVTKGKGFQGVVKRHRFSGGPRSHGQKHSEREPGSIGGGGRAGGRVAKGMRMAGRMGNARVTVKNLRVLSVDKENNFLLVSGAVPGRRGTLLEVRG